MQLRHHHHQQHEHQFGSLVSAKLELQIRNALHDWRSHMAHGSELTTPFDPERDHLRGDAAAPVVVVEYGELSSQGESQDDRVLREKLGGLLDSGRICLAFRHFPIIDSHPGAWLAAQAVEAADRQGCFWDLHSALTDLETLPWARELDASAILTAARSVKLDVARLEADMHDTRIAERILQDLESGFLSGVNGAPTFYVQGIRQDIDGPEELLARIESAVAGDFAALWPPVHRAADEPTRPPAGNA